MDLLWRNGQPNIFFTEPALKIRALHSVDAPSMLLSLDRHDGKARLLLPFTFQFAFQFDRGPSIVNVHRFEEIINGREYRIEVSNVGLNKWRAQIARAPGGSAATMPFYGTTPVEAAGQLSRWLALAHGQPGPQL